MTDVASRELRNNTRDLIRRAESGESIVITVDGRPAAVLKPTPKRNRWIARDDFEKRFLAKPTDPGLRDELAELAPDTTEDLDTL